MPHAHLKYQLFAELISLLEKERFVFGVDRHLKLQELWAKLPDDMPVDQLKRVLCSAIATSAQQQTLFYELFDEAWERVQAIHEAEKLTDGPIKRSLTLPWIVGTILVLLGILALFLYPYLFPATPPPPPDVVRAFNVTPGDTLKVAPTELQMSTWGRVQQSYFCADSITQSTQDSSVFGSYRLVADSLEYIARDSIGLDSICVTMVDSAGLAHRVIFQANINLKPVPKPPTTPKIQPSPPTRTPLFAEKPLPNFDQEISLLEIQPPTKLEQFIANNIKWLRWLVIALLLLLLGLILRYREQRRRTLVAQLESQDKPPYVWNIELDSAQDILLSEGFERMVNTLRQRTREDHFQIDIPKTVSATVDQAGMPTLAYRQQTRPPEYLMLIDRQSRANHRSQLFDWIYQALVEQEVFVERYFFDGDIRTCFNEKHEHGISITELQYLHPNARLLIFSHGYQFLSSRGGKLAKWTQIFDQWKQKILFSSRPTQQWGRREQRLRDQFFLLPATMEGLQFFAQEIENLEELPVNSWREVVTDAYAQPIALEGGLISSLRQYYSEQMLQWIACCAVYPALHWDLTLFMGRQLATEEAPLLTVDQLNSLTRLPWFVEGQIPPESRATLVDHLQQEHPETLQEARTGLLTILQENPPPEDSTAWDDYQLQLSLNEWLSTKDPKRKKELEQQIADLLDQGVEADFVALKYLEEPGPLDFVVPQQWKKYFYHAGYSGLGTRRWLKDLWWALPLWLLLSAACFWYVPAEGCAVNTIEYEGKYLCLDENWKKSLYQKFLAKLAIELNDRDSLIKVTQQRDSLARDLALTLSIDPPPFWHNSPDSIYGLSLQQIDSLEIDSKELYAHYSFNQYVARYHYNQGVDFANLADSLIRLNDLENYTTYIDSACFHFSEAWPLDAAKLEIQRARFFCSGVRVFVQLDQGLANDYGESIKESLLRAGFPSFDAEKVTIASSNLRYFYAQDRTIARTVLQSLQDSFAFAGGIEPQFVPKYNGNRDSIAPGDIELWIDDNQPAAVLLNGQIVDAESRQAIAGAQISWNGQTIASNQEGNFNLRIPQPSPNQIEVQVSAENYEPSRPSFAIGNTTDLGTIELSPIPDFVQVALNRQIVDGENQSPLANAQVRGGGQNFRTDENGNFQLNLELPRDTTMPLFISMAQYQIDTLSLQVQSGQARLQDPAGNLINGPLSLFSLVADQDKDKVPDIEDRCPTLAGSPDNQGCPTTITDTRDQQEYPVVIIGEQVWLGKNLNYSTDDSWCYLELPQACQRAGRLYTWEAAKNACPAGWHLPSDEEWQQLARTAGGYYDFVDSKEIGSGNTGFRQLIEGGPLQFNALLGGYRDTDGSFLYLGAYGNYWSATESGGGVAYVFDFFGVNERLDRGGNDQGVGLSVRCLQN